MRLPTRPPDWLTLIRAPAVGTKHEFGHEAQAFVSRANSEYWHWDQVRRHPAPCGWDSETLWSLIKIARVTHRHEFGLQAPDGRPFWYWLPETAQNWLREIDRQMGPRPPLLESSIPISDLKRFAASSLAEEAIASSRLEGAATTREQAKEMLRRGRPPRTRGEQMVLNNYRTMLALRDYRREPLSLDLLLELQRSVTVDTLDDPSAAGRLRSESERVQVVDVRDSTLLHDPPPARQLLQRLVRLCMFANGEGEQHDSTHPIVRAILLHFWLAYEHPFVDGNGRTGRALFYWSALRQGYKLFEFLPVSRIIARTPIRYGRSFLYARSDEADATYTLMFNLRSIQTAGAEMLEHLQSRQQRIQEAKVLQRRYERLGLNDRQVRVLQDALADDLGDYTIARHRGAHGVSYGTAYNDLDTLVKRGILSSVKRGKQWVYYAADDLGERLAGMEPAQ